MSQDHAEERRDQNDPRPLPPPPTFEYMRSRTPELDRHPREQRDQAEDGPRIICGPGGFSVDLGEQAESNGNGCEDGESDAGAQRTLPIRIEMDHGARMSFFRLILGASSLRPEKYELSKKKNGPDGEGFLSPLPKACGT